MAITLRNTKSTPLTFEELDGNFTDLNSRLNTIETTNVTACLLYTSPSPRD